MANNRESKRGRKELSSAEEETLSHDLQSLRETMDTMQKQLQKLDLLQKMSEDITELKRSLEFSNALIDVLKEENAALRVEVNALKFQTTQLQKDKQRITADILDLQCRGMRENVIIHGIPEEAGETYRATENLVRHFMKENLGMNEAEVKAINLPRVHRIGQKRNVQQRPRPVVAKFLDFKKKLEVMEKARLLK